MLGGLCTRPGQQETQIIQQHCSRIEMHCEMAEKQFSCPLIIIIAPNFFLFVKNKVMLYFPPQNTCLYLLLVLIDDLASILLKTVSINIHEEIDTPIQYSAYIIFIHYELQYICTYVCAYIFTSNINSLLKSILKKFYLSSVSCFIFINSVFSS